MFPSLLRRIGPYCILLVISSCLFLPRLGTPSLWDIDEGHNAQAAREMREAANWITPTFNYQLRVDKPALLYWLQMAAYRCFDVNEFAARLPSALASLLTVLLTFALGRQLFDTTTGLLAGIVLASALLFCGSAHFANPDALLNACTIATFFFFWRGFVQGHSSWLLWIGVTTGLGCLAKGPVAIVMPASVIGIFLLWSGKLRTLLCLRLVQGLLLWGVVTLPWYAIVGSETKGEFLSGFFLKHNLQRFTDPLEGHHGPIWYHLISLLIGFLPWSVFLGPALWLAWREVRGQDLQGSAAAEAPAVVPTADPRWPARFLFCWLGLYFVFFSLSRTKLPNYLLPLYPAAALVTGHYLDQWRRGLLIQPRWVMILGLHSWAIVGVGTVLTFLIISGSIPVSIPKAQQLPGLANGVWLGLVPLLGANLAWWYLRKQQRTGVLACLGGSAVLYTAAFLIWGAPAVDSYKAPRALVAEAQICQPNKEVRVGCYRWYQPSLVFYCQREVQQFPGDPQALEFLQSPLEVYLFLPAQTWATLQGKAPRSCHELARHRCLYRNCDVVVVTNR